MSSVAFILIGGFALGSALAVIFFRNPVHSALALVLHLLSIAGLYAIFQAHFLAVVQISVYAGAIMVLVLFVLMLLNVKSDPSIKNDRGLLVVATVSAALLGIAVVPQLLRAFPDEPSGSFEGTAKVVGLALFSDYLVRFQMAGALLTAAVVGAVMLSKRRSRNNVAQNASLESQHLVDSKRG